MREQPTTQTRSPIVSRRSPTEDSGRDTVGEILAFCFQILLEARHFGVERRFGLRDRGFGPGASFTHTGCPLVLQLPSQLLQFLVRVAARGAKSRFIFRSFLSSFCQTGFGQLPGALGSLVALAQYFLQWLEEDKFEIKVQ